jgi:hypothetical protein
MQFGKIHGIALVVLGLFLLAVQAFMLMGPPKAGAHEPEATTKTVETKPTLLPGIVGGISLIAGVWIFRTARRSDQPPPKDTVK